MSWEFPCRNLLWPSVSCSVGQAPSFLQLLSQEKLFSSPPHKPFVAKSLTRLLTCFGISCAEAFCDSGWLRPPSKAATGQDSCKGGSEGFCLVPAAAGSGHSSPGGWHGLNHRTASVLIRNAGKRLVPFRKEPPPTPHTPCPTPLSFLVLWEEALIIIYWCLFMGILQYVLTSQTVRGRCTLCKMFSLVQSSLLSPPSASSSPPSSVTSVRRCSSSVAQWPWMRQAAPFFTFPVDAGVSPATLCLRSSNQGRGRGGCLCLFASQTIASLSHIWAPYSWDDDDDDDYTLHTGWKVNAIPVPVRLFKNRVLGVSLAREVGSP